MDGERDTDERPAKRFDWRHTQTKRRNFLRVLAETYDTDAACRVAGLTWPQVCELRTRHPDFAERFEEVIAAGYDRLEAMLLRQAGVAGAAVDAALAQALLKQRRAGRSEGGAAPRRGMGRADPRRGEVIRQIVAELTPLRRAREGRQSGTNGKAAGAGGTALRAGEHGRDRGGAAAAEGA